MLTGIAKPAWLQGMSWSDAAGAAMWRADETELLPGEPVGPDLILTLSDAWWEALNTPAHGDLNWANVTAPQFCLFDWDDWGMALRGIDAAWLWGNSLVFPEVAERVQRERRHDLESRDGKLMSL